MNRSENRILSELIEKGVRIPASDQVWIDDNIDPDRISGERVVLFPGTRLSGASTLVLSGAQIGEETPATIENCWIGPDVKLKGGYFRESVFLAGASVGSGGHVREGCIFEEGASAAHTVGLKHTILFPWVTLGSLVNFCDCFVSGGTGKKNHSEVGSSFIHFNFTPLQDKATPSLIGDVPAGVMLDQPPIFLGGQGGLVGPVRLGYAITTAAGTIWRKDELRTGRLLYDGFGKQGNIAYQPGKGQPVQRIVTSNLVYIANLLALHAWYDHVRRRFVSSDFPESLLEGLISRLDLGIRERVARLVDYLGKIAAIKNESGLNQGVNLPDFEKEMSGIMAEETKIQGDKGLQNRFLDAVEQSAARHEHQYIPAIQNLSGEYKDIGTRWLQDIMNSVSDKLSDSLGITSPAPGTNW